MRTQFIVSEKDTIKRKEFFDYIMNTYCLKLAYPFEREKFINNKFPFVVDFNTMEVWICESITSLACAKTSGVIFDINEFKKLTKSRKKEL